MKINVPAMVLLREVATNPGALYLTFLRKKEQCASSNEVPRQSLPSEGYLCVDGSEQTER